MFKQLALSSAMLLASLISPAAQAAPIVSLVASAPSVTVGSNFTVSLRIEGVTDLFGWDADLNFGPPALVGLLSQGTGSFFGGDDTFVAGSLDPLTGTIGYVGAALSGLTGASGDGFLAEFTFTALMAGVMAMDFDRVSLIDSFGNDIFIETSDRFGTRITIAQANRVPVPGSLALGLLALALLPAAARRPVKSARS